MKKIDEIRKYLENGYKLNITTNERRDCYYGSLVLSENRGSEMYSAFLDIQEVDVDQIMKYFPKIQEQINGEQWLEIYCPQREVNTNLIVSHIVRREYYGPYGEKSSIYTVGNLSTKAPDVLTALIEFDAKIAQEIENKEDIKKEQIKKL